MSILLWCLFFAALLHVLSKLPLIVAMAREAGGYDNNTPREQQASLKDWGKRALAAHENQIESFPLYAAAILVAVSMNIKSGAVEYLAISYLVARVLYIICYVKDQASLRSVVWSIGFISSLAIMCSPAWA